MFVKEGVNGVNRLATKGEKILERLSMTSTADGNGKVRKNRMTSPTMYCKYK